MILEQYQQMGTKAESVELTPETLVAADYALAWHNIGGVQADDMLNERRVRRASFAPLQPVGGAVLARCSGTFEPVPSGIDNTAPGWYHLLAAAGATISGDIASFGAPDTSYTPKGTAVTVIHKDGAYARTSAGTRLETLKFSAEKGGIWLAEFTGVGRYSQASDTSFLSVSAPTISGKPFLGHAVSLGGSAVPVASAEISIENAVSPVEDGTHASGYGKNVITAQKIIARLVILDEGVDYRDKFRNDASGDVLALSLQMSTGSAGNVLTWAGNIALVEKPDPVYRDGNGYRTIVGEFIANGSNAVATLTQT